MALPPIRSRRALIASAVLLAVPLTLALDRAIPDEPTTVTTPTPITPEPANVAVPPIAKAKAVTSRTVRPRTEAQPAGVRSVPGQAGMVVAIDPETGQLVLPTPEQRAELGIAPELLERDYADLPLTILPNGTWKVTLDDRYMDYTVVRRAADGSLDLDCVRKGSTAAPANGAPASAVPASAAPAPAPVWEVR
ncbi:MAG: post-PEP-CTERM-1 domain-containing protein [Candidatus Eiseniibacteriota bacterium]